MRKIDKMKHPDGITKEKKEILKGLVGSASSPSIDLNRTEDELKYGKITEQDIERFMENIAVCLMTYYNYLTMESTLIAVQQSTFPDLMRKYPEQTLCYGERYWAEDIIEELKELKSK